MNYLAHFLLAEGSAETIAGNFLGDFVKGRIDPDAFPLKIAQGIHTHRAVDAFADRHRVTAISKTRFSAERRRIAGIIVDIAYDHFLAKNWERFHPGEIDAFIDRSYDAVTQHAQWMPNDFRSVIARMKAEDWLSAPLSIEGMVKTFKRMSHRSPVLKNVEGAVDEIQAAYFELEADFLEFFPDVVQHVRERATSR